MLNLNNGKIWNARKNEKYIVKTKNDLLTIARVFPVH